MKVIRVHFKAVELSNLWFNVDVFEEAVEPNRRTGVVAEVLDDDSATFLRQDAGGFDKFIDRVEIVEKETKYGGR